MNSVISNDEIKKKIDYYAKEFSEGNPILENLLKEMWQRDYETIGCCTGHEDDETSRPYIAFVVNNKSKTINLLSSINKDNIRIGFVTDNGKLQCSISALNDQDIFQDIIDSLDKDSNNEDILNYLDKMLELDNNKYNNLIIYYRNNKIDKIRFNTNDMVIVQKLIDKGYSYQKLGKISNLVLYQFIIK